jgi:cytidyltransferase-like protein
MPLSWNALAQYRGQVTMVDGGFDPLHAGHVAYFEKAAALGFPVLCNVASDAYVATKHPPLLPEAQRIRVLEALRPIALVHLNSRTTAEVLMELQPRYYVKGKDWEGRLPAAELEACHHCGTQIVYLDTVTDSSTRLLQAVQNTRLEGQVERFEAWMTGQRPVDATHYDAEYFVDPWRPGANQYTLEARRPIEGRNPALIREIFQPVRVLDFGCGPGILMALLQEEGLDVEGLDFSAGSRELAPASVRERLHLGSVTDPPLPDASYDLVVCREVLEHLTVREVRQAVFHMARLTSRFVYVTTRFHPPTDDLLAVTTQFDVDPSHITLLTKPFLRVLFLLEGLRSRPDLEARMDWMGKGRVLVMERP